MLLNQETETEKTIEESISELAFDKMTARLRSMFGAFPDKRIGDNLTYDIEDIALGAFSLFFTQSPWFLAFQTTMIKNKGRGNAESLFGIKKIPCDNHIRDILDGVCPSAVFAFFNHIVSNLKTAGIVDSFRSYGGEALYVNWCEIVTTDDAGRVLYKKSFAATFSINRDNVRAVVADGRARWKIENENNNVLKNNGYHLTHNFGHGKKFLSMTLATLNILAFLFQTVLDLTDKKYRALRQSLPSRQTFFDDIRALTRYLYFERWEKLLDYMIYGLESKHPVPDTRRLRISLIDSHRKNYSITTAIGVFGLRKKAAISYLPNPKGLRVILFASLAIARIFFRVCPHFQGSQFFQRCIRMTFFEIHPKFHLL